MRIFLAVILFSISVLGACDVPVKSQFPSHVAQFEMKPDDYSKLISAMDAVADPFALKRVGAAPGLEELHGREVLFAAYEPKDPGEWRGALEVNDLYGPGQVLVRVYGDYFDDPDQRAQFVAEVHAIVRRFGGTLRINDDPSGTESSRDR